MHVLTEEEAAVPEGCRRCRQCLTVKPVGSFKCNNFHVDKPGVLCAACRRTNKHVRSMRMTAAELVDMVMLQPDHDMGPAEERQKRSGQKLRQRDVSDGVRRCTFCQRVRPFAAFDRDHKTVCGHLSFAIRELHGSLPHHDVAGLLNVRVDLHACIASAAMDLFSSTARFMQHK